jgi:hypothetical protein
MGFLFFGKISYSLTSTEISPGSCSLKQSINPGFKNQRQIESNLQALKVQPFSEDEQWRL